MEGRADPRAELLSLVEGLAREIHGGSAPAVRLDSSLDHDLGLDSLARAELLLRIERHFGLRLPEGVLASALTPRDLLRAVAAAPAAAGIPQFQAAVDLGAVEGRPEAAASLVEVLEWHAAAHPERLHVLFHQSEERAEELTYAGLLADARRVAGGLDRLGLVPGRAVAIMLPSGLDFFRAFFGTLLAGGVPVPLCPPVAMSQLAEELRRQSGILANSQSQVLISMDEAKLAGHLLKARLPGLEALATVGELAAGEPAAARPVLTPGDTALLQYTSGSTGNPKGVVLSHANLLANIRAWSRAAAIDSTDVCVSWLPLYHDMGLIGTWLGSLYNACPLVLLPPTAFLERPARWLWAIHGHRGTVSAAPNFAFELCLKRTDPADLQGLDLSSWRLAANGAEPVSPDTVERFCRTFAPYGFSPGAMTPMYGLAECSVGLAVPPLGRGPVIDRIRRQPFMAEGRALPAPADDPAALRFVACGRPLAGHELRVVDEADRELPERTVGRLQFRGPSATSGYFRNAPESRRLFHGPWLDSGDLAYLAAGEVYPTSRAKDMIIRAGRNLYPYGAEEAIGNLPGVRKGCVAVVGAPDPVAGTERLVAVVETREQAAARRQALVRQAGQVAREVLDTPVDEVLLVPPRAIPKTTSGKIRRAATRDRYLAGELGLPPPPLWRQLASALVPTLGPALERGVDRLAGWGYTAYGWLLLVPFYALVWLLTVALGRPDWNWRLTGGAARIYLRLLGIPLAIEGVSSLPPGPCVAVANHSSYLDGLVLMAALKRPFSFVAKRELDRQWVAGTYLRAVGTEFVERFDAVRGVQDQKELSGLARAGRSLFFFPEGTFVHGAGLQRFHLGAFLAAAGAGLPVVPVAIRGTRQILRSGSWRLHRGAVAVTVGEAVPPVGGEVWEAALEQQKAAREFILAHCGEPDLTG